MHLRTVCSSALIALSASAQAPREAQQQKPPHQAVLVVGERIQEVGPAEELARKAGQAQVIDLGDATLLPGLIDNHTHVLLQGDITAADYDEQLLKESTP